MKTSRRVEAGAVAGLLAGIAIAVFFVAEGAIHLHPLRVPVDLASGLLGAPGGGGPLGPVGAFAVRAFEVLVYTVIHLLAFVGIGVVAALLPEERTFWTSLFGGVLYGSIMCTGVLYATRWILGVPVALDLLGLGRVLLANAAAGAIIGVVLYLTRMDAARGARPATGGP